MSTAKKEHYNKLYDKIEIEKDTRNLYNLTYELIDKKNGNTPQTLISDGKIIRKPKLMANLQVNFYENKVKELISKIPNSNRDPHRFLDYAMSTWLSRSSVP